MNDENELYLFMDETARPYEEGENPFSKEQMDEFDEITEKIIKKYGLAFEEDENDTDS